MDWYERRQIKGKEGFTGKTYLVTFRCGDWDSEHRRVIGSVGTMEDKIDEFDGFNEAFTYAEKTLFDASFPREHFGEEFEAIKAHVGEIAWENGRIKSNVSVAEIIDADEGWSFPFHMYWMNR